MSIIKSIKQQLGLGPAAENHFWDGSVPNQLSLKRGTPEAPGTELIKALNGKVTFPQASQVDLSDQLMGGNIIKMFRSIVTFDGTGTTYVAFSTPFGTSVSSVVLTNSNIAIGGEGVVFGVFAVTTSGFSVRAIKGNPYGVYVGDLELSYIAIGY